MRAISLTTARGGIDRLRTKGGARADTLYDLVNAYVREDGSVVPRAGTIRIGQPVGTKGLCAFEGELHVFAITQVTVEPPFVSHVIANPNDSSIEIAKIPFAQPLMGALYVVAEFEDGSIYHYWLQAGSEWAANTIYRNGDVVEPTTPNGLLYRASRASAPYASWAPRVGRTVGGIVEPTVYNDFYYQVVATIGNTPSSGVTEPIWPETEGAQVTENVDVDQSETTITAPPDIDVPPSTITNRYG